MALTGSPLCHACVAVRLRYTAVVARSLILMADFYAPQALKAQACGLSSVLHNPCPLALSKPLQWVESGLGFGPGLLKHKHSFASILVSSKKKGVLNAERRDHPFNHVSCYRTSTGVYI